MESISIILLLGVVLSPIIILTQLNKKQQFNFQVTGEIIKYFVYLFLIFISIVTDVFEINFALSFICFLAAFIVIRKSTTSSFRSLKRYGWEIFFVSISFIILSIFFYEHEKWIITAAMLIFSVANLYTKVFSTLLPVKLYNVTHDEKSIGGSLAFFITVFIVILFLSTNIFKQHLNTDIDLNVYLISVAVILAVLLTVFEAISSLGSDNLLIPVFCGLLLYVFLIKPNYGLVSNFTIGSAIALVIVVISYYVRFLTLSGSTATFLLASFIFGFGGLKWSIPIMAFFILSSILSKIRKKVNDDVEKYFEKSGVRDHWQVVANGGIGGVLVILNLIYPSELFYFIYVSSLAAVCADTWATEIGTMYKTKTYNILTFKLIDQGVSGGISLVGTLGGMLGAMIIAFSGLYWIEINNIYFVLFIIISGVSGSIFDSILGATIQAQFECEICGKLTEKEFHCNKITTHKRGFNWLNNDFVNLLAGIGGGIFILLFKELLS